MKYIECEAAIRDICEWATNLNNPKMLVREDVIGILENIPAADVRPVVLCKDCIMYECQEYDGGLKYVCRLFKRQMQETDFCSYGKKRDES